MEYDIDEEDNFISKITHKNKLTNNPIKMVICFLCGSYPIFKPNEKLSLPHKCLFNKNVTFNIRYTSKTKYSRYIIIPSDFDNVLVRKVHYYSVRYYNTCDKKNYEYYLKYKDKLYWNLPENKRIIYYLINILGTDITKLIFLHIL